MTAPSRLVPTVTSVKCSKERGVGESPGALEAYASQSRATLFSTPQTLPAIVKAGRLNPSHLQAPALSAKKKQPRGR